MFELWIATWCYTYGWASGKKYCKDQSIDIFKSSTAAVYLRMDLDGKDEIWLYPVRDFDSEVWCIKINRSPVIEIKKEKTK